MAAAAAMGEGVATGQKRKKKPKPNHLEVAVAPSQSLHASMPLPAALSLQTPTQSPAPGTPILEEAAAEAAVRRKRKMRKEQKAAPLPLVQNPTLEAEAVLATATKKKHRERKSSPSPSSDAAAGTLIVGQEAKVPLAQTHTLEEEQEQEQGEEAVLATTTKKKKKCKERKSSPSPSTAAAAGTPILEQEAKVTKKRHGSKDQEPSGYSPLPLDHGQTQSQGTKAPHASKPPAAVPFLEDPARSPAPGTSVLEDAAMRKRKMCKVQRVAALSLAQDTTLEEQREDGMAAKMMKKKESKHIEHTLSSPSTSVAAETPVWEQEGKVNKKRKHTKVQEPFGKSPLPLDPWQTQPQGANAPHASKCLATAPFPEAPAPSAAPGTPMSEEVVVAAAVAMRKLKICKEQKVAARSLAKNTTLEEQREDTMAAKMMKRESKHMEHTPSSHSTSVAAETTICEKETVLNKKQKQRKQQEPSGKSPLPPYLGQAHRVRSQGGKAPPEQEREADGQKGSSMIKNNGKRPRVRVLSKRELIKEASKKPRALPEGFVAFSDFVSSCTEQNPDHSSPSPYSAFFDQFRYNPVREDHKPPLPKTPDRLARLPSRGHSSLELSQLTVNETSRVFKSNISVASKTKQQDLGSSSQEKVNVQVKENSQKKTREKKQRKPSDSSLPDPSQTCCVQLQGTKGPPEQDQKADVPKVDNIKKSISKQARVRAPRKRKLFKEMIKEQMLPEGFLAPCDLVPNCTEQNPDYSSPSGASFHQFCYRSAYQARSPQPPGTTDCLSMSPPRDYPSFELSELSANGTPKSSKANSSVARKSKKKDSGSGSVSVSREKLHEKNKNPEKKTTKQREPPPLLTPAEKCSDKYRRVPLDQLVPPPRSPHHLLQENYASDPWKVIVICMLLNLTQGKQLSSNTRPLQVMRQRPGLTS